MSTNFLFTNYFIKIKATQSFQLDKIKHNMIKIYYNKRIIVNIFLSYL